MTRHWFLPHFSQTLLLALFSIAAIVPAARSQDATTEERLDHLERDLSMLQRQVYRDGVSPGEDTSNGAGSNLAVDTQIRMGRLEQQMRDLTGRVEDESNQVQQLRQRLEQISSDIDVRFGELNQGAGQARAGGPPPTSAPPSGIRPEAFAGQRAGGANADLPVNGMAPPPPYGSLPPAPPFGSPAAPGALVPTPGASGTLTPPEAAPPRARPALQPADAAFGGGLPPSAQTLPSTSASASAQYNSAFGLLRRADYPAAEDAFRSFVEQHPDSGLAGSAQYWLGESYYARSRYSDAAVAFAEGYKRYPKGLKASETLLRLGMALSRAHQRQNACIALVQLDHDFPHAASAVKERAATEKKRLGC
jgi:tol-pal system protein YbgF